MNDATLRESSCKLKLGTCICCSGIQTELYLLLPKMVIMLLETRLYMQCQGPREYPNCYTDRETAVLFGK